MQPARSALARPGHPRPRARGRGGGPPRQGRRGISRRAISTRVGERGITLSGGQKQRTAIARALYRDPRILILDDALSAVDTQTEEEILARPPRGFARARTTLIVAHRISTVRDADLILVLDDGRIVEARHARVARARAGGLYARLHRQQQLEAELAAS